MVRKVIPLLCMCNCKARSKISSSNNNLGRAVMIRCDMQLLNLRPPGRCLELLAKEDAARAKIATRKRNPDVRQTEAKRRMDAKLADDLETLKLDLKGDRISKARTKYYLNSSQRQMIYMCKNH